MKAILDFFKKHKGLIIIGIAIIFALLFLQQCQQTRNAEEAAAQEKAMATQNLKAMQDSVRIDYDKKNEKVFEKMAFVAKEISDVKLLNKDLYEKLEAVEGKVQFYASAKVGYKAAPAEAKTKITQHGDSLNVNWDYKHEDKGSSQIIEGITYLEGDSAGLATIKKKAKTIITKNELKLAIDVGLKTNKKGDTTEIFVKSLSPYITISDIQGVTFFPNTPEIYKPRRTFAMGPNMNVFYNPFNNRVVPSIGVGVQWNVISFGPKIKKRSKK